MKNSLVRKFQLPGTGDGSPTSTVAPAQDTAKPAPTPAATAHTHHAADCEIPEINTDFIDNLWQDPAFLDRFDAGFDKTVPMGLDGAQALDKERAASRADKPVEQNLLDIDFLGQGSQKK